MIELEKYLKKMFKAKLPLCYGFLILNFAFQAFLCMLNIFEGFSARHIKSLATTMKIAICTQAPLCQVFKRGLYSNGYLQRSTICNFSSRGFYSLTIAGDPAL